MKAVIRKTIILSLLLLCCQNSFTQVLTRKQFIKAVQDADIFYYYDEDYEQAARLYESLLAKYPDNLNLSAKLGICYLNIDGKKEDALKLLNAASKNVIENDKEYEEFGDKAPLDTYLYLAIAYHKNDSLQKAISLYYDAKNKLGSTEVFRKEYIDNQIRDCRYAEEMRKKPLAIISSLFTPWLNEYPGASNPVVSKNDSVFIFTLKTEGKTHIYCSYKSDKWKKPVDISKQLGGYNKFYSNSITGDGKLLIVYMDDGGDGNLYYSQRKDSTWTKIKNLGRNINTIYWESHGFITPDGKTIYFASNRPGGEGELDIWISEKSDDGTWNKSVNCGNIINSPFNENTPFFDPQSNTLLFSSLGHAGMGDYDEFRSVKENGKWSSPIGLPYALNSTVENTFFILNNNKPGFITSIYNDKEKSRNIYTINTEEQKDKTIFAQGTVYLQDGMAVDPEQMRINLTDQKTGILIRNISLIDSTSANLEMKPENFKVSISKIGVRPDTLNLNTIKKGKLVKNKSLSDTASYNFKIKPGDYHLTVSHAGYKSDTTDLNIPSESSGNYISIVTPLIPEKVFNGDFLSIKNILFEFDSFKINESAISTLEVLKSILLSYPELKIEVAGYTDSKGSAEYNMNLADKRAEAVINYLSASGISQSRFLKKAFGESNFEAKNTNWDGSDNPEGRKYNRRATIGIVDPQTNVVIRQDTYTPEHLRQPNSLKYSIILIKSGKNLAENYFNNLKMNQMNFIKSIKVDSVLLYYLGVFYNKNDATKYLEYVKGNGFKEAYIVYQYEIINSSESLIKNETENRLISGKVIYTIQLKASKKPLNMLQFKDINSVREIKSDDGYYRYIFGEYNSFTSAKAALVQFQDSEFKSAFIRDINSLINK
jgi:outer membrane protein OmpA-like peptidoglycan-associated protein/tetratricopeptide (TPR) repeat protein